MNAKRQAVFASVISIALLFQPDGRAQAQASGFEPQPSLSAADLVPASLIRSSRHTLNGSVRLEGFRAVFDIDSAQGQFRAAGREQLLLRIAELPAIESLRQVNKSEAFTDALAKAAKAPLAFVGNVLSDPGTTLGNVASGLGQLVESAGSVVQSGLERVTDGASDMANATAKPVEADGEQQAPSFISDPFGYNKARRLWAKTLAVDPYTSNPVLRQLLDDAASATFAGSFAVDATLGIVAAPVKFVVGMDVQSQDMVWDLSPSDIQVQVESKLKSMGIEGRPVRDFFRNPWITPTLQTGLANALERLTSVTGRAGAIELASKMQSEARLRNLIETLNLLADHHRTTAPLAELRLGSGLTAAIRGDGQLVAAMSADYFFWNAAAAEFANRADLTASRRTLLLSGKASARSRQELERSGWVLAESEAGRGDVTQTTAGR